MNDKGFYRYIYPRYNGYQILKDNIHYGWYEDLTDALYDRDNLERCDWDLEEFVWLPERENKYKNMKLPPVGLKRDRQYIYWNGSSFYIKKNINGEYKRFGTFKSLDEAKTRRDELLKNGWKT